MIASLLKNKLILAIVVLVVLFGAWYGLSSSGAPVPVLSSDTSEPVGDNSILSTLTTLQTITLKAAIFSDPAFATLQDFTTAIVSVPSGRPDPFAPLPQSAQSTVTTGAGSAKGAQIFKPVK